MKSWQHPSVPTLDGVGVIPRIFDSATQRLVEARPAESSPGVASIYVCGITPYDATHLGHAATYLAFDTLIRVWLDCGFEVRYVQNSTDVDDPLLERATRDGLDWRELAQSQTDLFRGDMEKLRIIPPSRYVAVTEVIPAVAEAVKRLEESGHAYRVSSVDAQDDLYFDSTAALPAWQLGDESSLSRDVMLVLSAERGGDPERPGKRDPLDPLLWRSERADDPAWDSVLGRGRPGWHIECSVIALAELPAPITVNGGGRDLVFPHHEFSAGHAAALTGQPLAGIYSHAGLVAYQGVKMSKSLGNLVLVSRLAAAGVDPRAIRLALCAQHYRSDWEWTDALLALATVRLASWVAWAAAGVAGGVAGDTVIDRSPAVLAAIRSRMADDLDTAGAIDLIDAAIHDAVPASVLLVDAIDALLGIRL